LHTLYIYCTHRTSIAHTVYLFPLHQHVLVWLFAFLHKVCKWYTSTEKSKLFVCYSCPTRNLWVVIFASLRIFCFYTAPLEGIIYISPGDIFFPWHNVLCRSHYCKSRLFLITKPLSNETSCYGWATSYIWAGVWCCQLDKKAHYMADAPCLTDLICPWAR
jgi:hypothetical protein